LRKKIRYVLIFSIIAAFAVSGITVGYILSFNSNLSIEIKGTSKDFSPFQDIIGKHEITGQAQSYIRVANSAISTTKTNATDNEIASMLRIQQKDVFLLNGTRHIFYGMSIYNGAEYSGLFDVAFYFDGYWYVSYMLPSYQRNAIISAIIIKNIG
jgi:hypothetical protein